jgi:SAM-dependent methyltransferase
MAEGRLYWRSAIEDEAMQDAHRFVWDAMLDTIDIDLAGTRVLDAGCNRGGFLCLLSDACGIAEGCGYDPAASAIDDARRLGGPRPLRFEVADSVPDDWGNFDAAFSHEVLYLIHDLGAHADAIFAALVPGGSYYAVMGVHAGSPLQADWHRAHTDELQLPELYNIDDVAALFGASGFEVAAARLKVGFVPAWGHSSAERDASAPTTPVPELMQRMEYYNEHKLLLRCRRPLHHD